MATYLHASGRTELEEGHERQVSGQQALRPMGPRRVASAGYICSSLFFVKNRRNHYCQPMGNAPLGRLCWLVHRVRSQVTRTRSLPEILSLAAAADHGSRVDTGNSCPEHPAGCRGQHGQSPRSSSVVCHICGDGCLLLGHHHMTAACGLRREGVGLSPDSREDRSRQATTCGG